MKKWIFPITTTCLLVGLTLSIQINLQNSIKATTTDEKSEVLISLIQNLEAEIASYEEYLSQLRKDMENINLQSSTGEKKITQLQDTLVEYQTMAGLTALEGPGITVTLDDNTAGLLAAPQEDANRYIIHYEKLLSIVSDLRRGKAEAISVNGQRIVASSEIRCVGNVILINTTRLAPPFEIRAIGDTTALEKAITSSDAFEGLRVSGFPVSYKLTTANNATIDIPAYTGTIPTKHLTQIPTDRE